MTPHSIVVVVDRVYCDYALMNHWDSNGVFFVVRHKDNIRYKRLGERPLPDKRAQEMLIDEDIELELGLARKKNPGRLRRMAVWNDERKYTARLLTDNFTFAASPIVA